MLSAPVFCSQASARRRRPRWQRRSSRSSNCCRASCSTGPATATAAAGSSAHTRASGLQGSGGWPQSGLQTEAQPLLPGPQPLHPRFQLLNQQLPIAPGRPQHHPRLQGPARHAVGPGGVGVAIVAGAHEPLGIEQPPQGPQGLGEKRLQLPGRRGWLQGHPAEPTLFEPHGAGAGLAATRSSRSHTGKPVDRFEGAAGVVAQLLAHGLAVGDLGQEVHGAAQHPHHIPLIQGGVGDHIAPAGAAGPGMHQPGEFRLPPEREGHLGPLLLAIQLAANRAQVVQGLLHRRRRRPGAPEVGAVHLGGDRLQHRRQLSRIEAIEVATHQRQPQPQLVVTPQGRHGAAHFGGLEALGARQAAEVAQHLDQGQEGVPVAVGAEVQQPLAFLDLQLQLLHPPPMLFELAAVAPAVGRLQLQLLLQLLHQLGLGLHLTGQVVLGRGHVVAAGHRGHRQGQAAAGLVAVVVLTDALQRRGLHLAHLQAAELGMQAHHGAAGHQDPEVVVGEAEQQGELPRTLALSPPAPPA